MLPRRGFREEFQACFEADLGFQSGFSLALWQCKRDESWAPKLMSKLMFQGQLSHFLEAWGQINMPKCPQEKMSTNRFLKRDRDNGAEIKLEMAFR